MIHKNLYFSPIFSGVSSLKISRSHFIYSFSPLLQGRVLSFLEIQGSSFSKFLYRPVGVENAHYFSIIIGDRYSITSRVNANCAKFYDCVFKDCISDVRGGAIYVSDSSLHVVIMRCGFLHCVSFCEGYSAGGVAVYSASSVKMDFCCFYNCSNKNDPGAYQVVPHGLYLNSTSINCTNEYLNGRNEVSSNWGSMSGGNFFTFNYNNSTRTYSINQHGGGYVFSTLTSVNCIGTFCQLSNSEGAGFISFIATSTKQGWFNYWNFINNSCLINSWIFHTPGWLSGIIPCFLTCSFIHNSNVKMSQYSDKPVFSGCHISSIDEGNMFGVFQDGTVFGSGMNDIRSINIPATEKCWQRAGSQTIAEHTLFKSYPFVSILGSFLVFSLEVLISKY